MDPQAYAEAVERWARSTWEAYSGLHSLARRWIAEALDAPGQESGSGVGSPDPGA